ncbi:hypothetical protein N7456_011302 [Penicillium angulare]|uniref:Uncharacterized protein n=1 Tax=Penicillium angulare TaxID=116970 RepID=A0A9W9ETP9_9EURO|nr:hypothetical protein N7456_011302 [Penicillium angulare]
MASTTTITITTTITTAATKAAAIDNLAKVPDGLWAIMCLAIMCLAVVAAACGVGFCFWKKEKGKKPDPAVELAPLPVAPERPRVQFIPIPRSFPPPVYTTAPASQTSAPSQHP